jgi:Cation transporting ATPase, C-terminus
VLSIDLGSDILPSLALGAEPPDADVMTRPPRPVNERLLSGPVVARFLFLGAIQAAGVCFAFFWRIHSAHLGFGHFTVANPVYREARTMTSPSACSPTPGSLPSIRKPPATRERGTPLGGMPPRIASARPGSAMDTASPTSAASMIWSRARSSCHSLTTRSALPSPRQASGWESASQRGHALLDTAARRGWR